MPLLSLRPLISKVPNFQDTSVEQFSVLKLQKLWPGKRSLGEFLKRCCSSPPRKALETVSVGSLSEGWPAVRKTTAENPVRLKKSTRGKARGSRGIDSLVSELREMPRDVTDEVLFRTLDRWAKSTRPQRRNVLRILKSFDHSPQFYHAVRLADWALKQDWFEACSRDFCRQMERYGKGRRFAEMESTFHEMQESGFPPDQVAYTILISSWGRVGEIEKALDYFNEMQAHGILPDVMTYSSVMSAYGEGGLPEKAEELLKEMEGAGIQSNLVSYTVVITAYGRNKKPGEAQRVFGEMQSRARLVPDKKVYTAFVGAHINAGNLDMACQLFQTMQSLGVEADDLARAQLVAAFGKSGECEKALRLVLDGESDGRQAGPYTYGALMNAFGINGYLVEARELFDEMISNKVQVTGRDYSNLFIAYARAGQEQDALDVKRKMAKAGYTPTLKQLNAMLDGLTLGGLQSTSLALSLAPKNELLDSSVDCESAAQVVHDNGSVTNDCFKTANSSVADQISVADNSAVPGTCSVTDSSSLTELEHLGPTET